jgi:predicted RNA-binding Zn ribbon-like protein
VSALPGRQAIVIEELDAVMIALQLAEDGLILKIRQCDTCGAWYFRKFSHQRWCTDDCKAAHYRTEPEKLKHAKAEKDNLPHRIKERKRVKKVSPPI